MVVAHRGGWVGGQHGGWHVQWEARTVGRRHVLGRWHVGEWRGWVGRHATGLGLHPVAGAGAVWYMTGQDVTFRNTHKSLLMYFQAEVPFPALPCPSWIHSGTSGTSGLSGTTWNKASPCDLTLLHHSYCSFCSFCSFCLSYVPSHTASQVPFLVPSNSHDYVPSGFPESCDALC